MMAIKGILVEIKKFKVFILLPKDTSKKEQKARAKAFEKRLENRESHLPKRTSKPIKIGHELVVGRDD